MRTIDLEVPTLGHVRLRVYHACPAFHCGSAIGAGGMGRSWADHCVCLWDIDSPRNQFALESAIAAALDPSPADLVRMAQDCLYEGPGA